MILVAELPGFALLGFEKMEGTPPAAGAASSTSSAGGMVSNQLAQLIPVLGDPSPQAVEAWSQKVELLVEIWPADRLHELAARLMLNTSGAAFQKLQLRKDEFMKNSKDAIKAMVTAVGGTYGQVPLERRYEMAERAIFRGQQKVDETGDLFLARQEVMWAELFQKKLTLENLQAYVVLRHSRLPPEDKKRIIVESGAEGDGSLSMQKVTSAIRMLQAGFFQEFTGGTKSGKLKTYDVAMLADDVSNEEAVEETYVAEEDHLEVLAQEGDEDAILVMQYEEAASELLQNDTELCAYYSAYQDARRRINERQKSRGFWNPTGTKGKSKGGRWSPKGRGKGKKSLQQRILSSRCRICDQFGHWKDECPNKGQKSEASTNAASINDQLPVMYLEDVPGKDNDTPLDDVNEIETFTLLEDSVARPCLWKLKRTVARKRLGIDLHQTEGRNSRFHLSDRKKSFPESPFPESPENPVALNSVEMALFASEGTLGVLVDLGASQTVMGSQHVKEFLNQLDPQIRKTVRKGSCNLTFRFGNHATLKSKQMLLLPLKKFWIRIAIVPGPTPFLISNSLLRSLGAVIDTENSTIVFRKLHREVKIQLSTRKLFLLDMNELWKGDQEAGSKQDFPANAAMLQDDIRQPSLQKFEQELPPALKLEGVPGKGQHESFINPNQSFECSTKVPDHMSKEKISCSEEITFHARAFQEDQEVGKPFSIGDPSDHDEPRRSFESPGRDAEGARDPSGVSHSGRDALEGDRLRLSSQRSDISVCVREPSRLGNLDGKTVRSQQEAGASHVLSLHADANGRDRKVQFCQDPGQQEEAKPRAEEKEPIVQQGRRMGHHGRIHCGNQQRSGVRSGGDPPDSGAGGFADAASDRQSRRHGEPDCRHASEDDGENRGSVNELQDPLVECAFKTELEKPGTVNSEWLQDLYLDCQLVEGESSNLSLRRLIKKFRRELKDVIAHRPSTMTRKPMHLLEVFCDENSQLTKQVRQLGGKAFRWGLEQGDLRNAFYRQRLFECLVEFDFEHVWCSPDCGPWCKWNQFNANRSSRLAEQVMEKRREVVWQVALCVVICEFQQAQRKYLHWEQPQGSAMWFLHELKGLFEVGQLCCFDLCRVAHLTVPSQPETFVKKGLAVLTNDDLFLREFHHMKCLRDHDHKAIAGTIETDKGRMSMSQWSGQYTRKFGRQIAQTVIRRRRLTLFAASALTTEEPASKKARTEGNSNSSAEPNPKEPSLKRRRIVGKGGDGQTPKVNTETNADLHANNSNSVTRESQISDMLVEAHKHAPRVGKKCLFEGEIVEKAQQLWPEMQIRVAVVSRGNRRYFPCPEQAHMSRNDAPSRLMICKGKLFSDIHVDEAWEEWERLVYQKAHKPCHPAKLSIMLFGKRKMPVETLPRNSTIPPPIPMHNSQTAEEPQNGAPGPIETEQPPQTVVDLVNSQHGPLVQAPEKRERDWLVRVHQNLGHPSNEKLCQMLRQQDVKAHICQAVADLKCAVCQETKRPTIARTAAIHEPADFNEIVSIDGVSWNSRGGQTFYFYHCVDHATCFQMAKRAESTDSQGAIEAFDQA